MKTKIKAVSSFMHGRIRADAGDELEVTKGEADELQKAGLVQIANEPEAAPQPAEAPAQNADDMIDVLGDGAGAKMGEPPENKMDPAPENKAGGKKTTARKAD